MNKLRSYFNARFASLDRRTSLQYFTSFVILHELSAVIPLPVIYYGLWANGFGDGLSDQQVIETLHIRQEYLDKARRVYHKYASSTTEDSGNTTQKDVSPVIVRMAASYAVVKLLMPARLALSAVLTPQFTRSVVAPISRRFR
ncbi:hypothetical protein MP228_010603 [Amoeboaphelidium protococcarum]|nr:hypothetical protein MP228_010603 [Amoeboaphelidium protococcarum]